MEKVSDGHRCLLRHHCLLTIGAEHRQTIAHGFSRGSQVPKDHQPQRGDRRGMLQCTKNSRETARMRRSHGAASRRDAENDEGNSTSSAVCRLGECSRRAASQDGNSVLLRLLAILAAVLLGLRAKGLTRSREDAKQAGRIPNPWKQRDSRMAMTHTLAASRLCGLSASCSGAEPSCVICGSSGRSRVQGTSVRRWVRFQSWISPWVEAAASHWRSGEKASW